MGYMSADAAERWLNSGASTQRARQRDERDFSDALETYKSKHAAPSKPATVKTTIDHTVVKGDTIWDLGVTFNRSVDEIVAVNPQFIPGSGDSKYDADHERTLTTGRDADAIWPGETIKIPVEIPAPVEPEPPPPAVVPQTATPAPTPPATTPPPTTAPAPPPATPAVVATLPAEDRGVCSLAPLNQVPYAPATDPLTDAAMWGKQGAFGVRVAGRGFLEGWFPPKVTPASPAQLSPQSTWADVWTANNVTAGVGLGGFALFQSVQKGREIQGYLQNGDCGQAVASGADLINGLRIGATGLRPFISIASNPAANWIESHLGGAAGTKLGIGANAVAGAGRAYSINEYYEQSMDAATTQREKDIATYTMEQAHIGNVLDTANDIAPYLTDNPGDWAGWLIGKGADHIANKALEGSGYQPKSIGADHARDIMPVLAAFGPAPTVEHYDLTKAMSDDERIVMEESNSIHKAAGIGAGVADVAVTTASVVVLGEYIGPNGALQAEHVTEQAFNVVTDNAWQRPDERRAAVIEAGLNPALDPHRVEYEQVDFLHRSAASFMADADIARLRGKVAAGGASADEKRYLEIVDQFENADIAHDNGERGFLDNILSPHSMWQATKLTIPGGLMLDHVPGGLGYGIGWVQGGGIGNTVEAVGDTIGDAKDAVVDFAGDTADAIVSAPSKLFHALPGL